MILHELLWNVYIGYAVGTSYGSRISVSIYVRKKNSKSVAQELNITW